MITTEIISIILLLLSTVFVLYRNKDFTLLLLHLIVMLFSIIIGVSLISINDIYALFVAFYGVVSFVVSVLLTKVY